MLMTAKIVFGFLLVCLFIMAQVAAGDAERGGHHAASIVILSAMLLVTVALVGIVIRKLKRE